MADKKALYEKLSFDWSADSIRLYVSPTPLSRELPYFVQEVGDFETFYPYYTERKNLKSYQLIYTLEGQGRLDYMGKGWLTRPGELLFIDCERHHRYFTEAGQTWSFLWLHFWGRSAQGFFRALTRGGFRPLPIADRFRVESLLRRILALNKKKAPGCDILSSHLIDSLLTELLLQGLDADAQSPRLRRDVDAVIREIEARFREKLCLDELAAQRRMSKFHLARTFKAATGSSINAYLINTRLNEGKRLLRESELSVSAVADEVGIRSVTHFINLFKKREGQTPLAYRKSWSSRAKKD